MGTTGWARPEPAPDRTGTALVTTYAYDAGGRLGSTVDPRGAETRLTNDALGRVKKRVEAYVDGNASPGNDRITEYEYTGIDQIAQVTVYNAKPTGGDPERQVTLYHYGSAASNMPTGIYYVGSGTPETFKYNNLGEATEKVDRDGVTHAYGYDLAGRLVSDQAKFDARTGPAIDRTVQKLTYGYDALGRQVLLSSKDGADHVINQVKRQYNGFGQLAIEWQEHTGEVNAQSTPKVQYGYQFTNNASRLQTVTYPSGRALTYTYTGLNALISRVSSIVDQDSTTLESYQYLGLSTVTGRTRSSIGVSQSIALDEFGHVYESTWTGSGGNAGSVPVLLR